MNLTQLLICELLGYLSDGGTTDVDIKFST
jgi:hypothetical protein